MQKTKTDLAKNQSSENKKIQIMGIYLTQDQKQQTQTKKMLALAG